jgi:hypothetical protein
VFRIVFRKVPWYCDFQRVRRELEIRQDVVQVDISGEWVERRRRGRLGKKGEG